MLPPVLLVLALVILAPWLPQDVAPPPGPESRLPVVLVAEAQKSTAAETLDITAASKRVVEGTAERLKARGIAVQPGKAGTLLVGQAPAGGDSFLARAAIGQALTSGETVTLSVGFSSGSNRWAAGTETRFGGDGDAAWRLATQVQRNLTGGLRDVLGHDPYDRGILEIVAASPLSGEPIAAESNGPWVAAYPLFATNPRERALLEWPETLDLISSALANAVYDYLSPALRTPPRSYRMGWRRVGPWEPVHPKAVWSAEHGTKLALTFDGGASSVPTPAILKALRDAGVRATMFMTADFVDKNPELVVQMAKDGHEFGNHSSTHPDMTRLSNQAIIAELERLEGAVQALTGKSTRPWFRPPFGASNDRLVQVAAEQGYYTIFWTADSADWRPEVSAATVQRRMLAYAAPGAILIEHLGSPQSAEVLANVLAALKEQGFALGTLSEVLDPID